MQQVRAAILAIGDEILYGQILNTNAQFISQCMSDAGFQVVLHSVCADGIEAITNAVTQAMNEAEITIITGGLGPTKDDITKHTLAKLFNDELALLPEALVDLEALLAMRKRPLNDLNKLQAWQPKKSLYLKNSVGTAPGMWFQEQGKVVVSLPGVRYEMQQLMLEQVLPKAKQHFQLPVLVHSYVRTVGIPESNLATTIADWEDALPKEMKLAYLPHFGTVKLRLSQYGTDAASMKQALEAEFDQVLPLLGDGAYSREDIGLEQVVFHLLKDKQATVASVESFTQGQVMQSLLRQSGASALVRGTLVPYQKEMKVSVAGIAAELLQDPGVYSEAMAVALAKRAQVVFQADYGIGTTGVAGPTTDDPTVAPGSVWLAVAGPSGVKVQHYIFNAGRDTNTQLAVTRCLNMLRLLLLDK